MERSDGRDVQRRLNERYRVSIPRLPALLSEAREEALEEGAREAVWEVLWKKFVEHPLHGLGMNAEAVKSFLDIQRRIPDFATEEMRFLPEVVDAVVTGSPEDVRELETRVTKNFCGFAIETEMSIQPLPGASVFVKRYVRPC